MISKQEARRNLKRRIRQIILLHYNKDEKKVDEWFKRPHKQFNNNTPEEVIDQGRGLELFNMINAKG